MNADIQRLQQQQAEKIASDREKAAFEADFRINPATDFRLMWAADYSAYQLGQINQSLRSIAESLKLLTER